MRGLRFASVEDMPPALRDRLDGDVELESWKEAHNGRRTIKPRRDDEHNAQVVFFNRIRALGVNQGGAFAVAARRTVAIPNGGGRSKREAGRLKAEGVLTGVSDVFCAVPMGVWHGLFIEMKSGTGTASPAQRAWIAESNETGYLAVVCRGADEAITVWKTYVDG